MTVGRLGQGYRQLQTCDESPNNGPPRLGAIFSGVFVVILYEIADNQIRVDKSLLAHGVSS